MFDMYMLIIVATLLFIVGGLWWHLIKEIEKDGRENDNGE